MDTTYLNPFEESLRIDLLRICTERGMLKGSLLESDDITDFWKKVEAGYVADAVGEIKDYPLVSVGWAAYLGLAVAYYWDTDWSKLATLSYEDFYGSDGFDNMDDHILVDILHMPLESAEAKETVSLIQRLAQETIAKIRHEQIEPQSPRAFYAFSRACKVMFVVGAAIEMNRLGYSYQKVDL